jgi:hypothetical protein
LACDQVTNLKAEKSSTIKCDCLSIHWTEVNEKSQCKIKSHCSSEDPDLNVKLSNKFEAFTVSEPSGVAQLKKKEDAKPIVSKEKCKKVLLLGSSHSRGLHEHLHSVLGDEHMVTNTFKPNSTFDHVVGELRALSKDFTKDVHMITVRGPGNRFDRDLNYRIEDNIDNIAKNSIYTNIGFVSLPKRHDRPHMSKWVRSVNLRHEYVLWNADRPHIGLIDVSSLNRYEHTKHGLHLNLKAKEKLVQLIPNEFRCKLDTGKIPVIIGARCKPFLG